MKKTREKVNPLINNQSLTLFVNKLNIDKDQRKSLVSSIPILDEDERVALLKTLVNVYLVNKEEQEALQKLKKYWEK
jgi:hypothetical protein